MWYKMGQVIGVILGYTLKLFWPTYKAETEKPDKVIYVEQNKDIHADISNGIDNRLREQAADSQEPAD